MTRTVARPKRLAFAALIAALYLEAGDANAARALRNELLARPPAAAGQPALSSLALEARLRRSDQLDVTGVTVDMEVSDIDRMAAERTFLQRQIDAELPMVGDYDENALNAFQRRVIRHEELARKFKIDFPAYQQHQQAYNDAVVDFERDCFGNFTAGDLDAAKARFGIK